MERKSVHLEQWHFFICIRFDMFFSHLSQGLMMPMVHNINEDDASTSQKTEPEHTEPNIVAEFTILMKKFANLKCIREYIKGHDIIYHNKLGKMSRFTSNVLLFYIDSN